MGLSGSGLLVFVLFYSRHDVDMMIAAFAVRVDQELMEWQSHESSS
jgi:hypothetical protein